MKRGMVKEVNDKGNANIHHTSFFSVFFRKNYKFYRISLNHEKIRFIQAVVVLTDSEQAFCDLGLNWYSQTTKDANYEWSKQAHLGAYASCIVIFAKLVDVAIFQ